MAVISGTEVLDAPLDHPREQGEDRTNLIINYLPQNMSDMELYSLFAECGSIQSAKIMRDKSSGYSFGYGFVQYEDPRAASTAIETLNGMQVAPNMREGWCKKFAPAEARIAGEDQRGGSKELGPLRFLEDLFRY